MKKIIALALALVMMLSVSAVVFAATPSPSGKQYGKIIVVYNDDDPLETHSISTTGEAERLTFKAKSSKDTDIFNGWIIYRKDGSIAKEGEDYDLEKGNIKRVNGYDMLTDPEITIVAKTDLIVAGNYNSKITNIKKAVVAFESKSPKDGEAVTVCLAAVMLVALAGVCVSKKQLAK